MLKRDPFTCPECGFDELAEPTYDEFGCPSFEICRGCGVEFGYDDTKVRAVIDWLPREQGGREKPPLGAGTPSYTCIIHFTDADEPWPPKIAWTLVVEKDEGCIKLSEWIADIHFLLPEAPHEALRAGREFDLYEGARRVAHGKILIGRFKRPSVQAP
jgi:hypothetical protein